MAKIIKLSQREDDHFVLAVFIYLAVNKLITDKTQK